MVPCGIGGIVTRPSWLVRISHSFLILFPNFMAERPFTNFTITPARSTGLPAWSVTSIVRVVMGGPAKPSTGVRQSATKRSIQRICIIIARSRRVTWYKDSLPELPEVETVVRSLIPRLPGRRIRNASFFSKHVVKQNFADLSRRLRGQTILSVRRHGKFIVLE